MQVCSRKAGLKNTGGGFAEQVSCLLQVVCTEATLAAAQRAAEAGRSLWRVSSTVFAHIASDVMLQPIGGGAAGGKHPPILAGDFVQKELEVINLKGQS